MFKQLLIASIAIAYVLSQGPVCNTRNCATCEAGKCTRCYNTFVDAFNNCAAVPPMQDKNCALYGLNAQCLMCNPGFALIMKGSGLQQGIIQCRYMSNPIRNCVSAKITPQGLTFCEMCQGGYPSISGASCGNWNPNLQTGLQQPMNPCVWGKRIDFFAGGRVGCGRCNSSTAVTNEVCQPSRVSGCLTQDANTGNCYMCDVWAGYTMKNNLSCVL